MHVLHAQLEQISQYNLFPMKNPELNRGWNHDLIPYDICDTLKTPSIRYSDGRTEGDGSFSATARRPLLIT